MREIMVGRQKVRLRGSVMNITKENAAALQLLHFLNREMLLSLRQRKGSSFFHLSVGKTSKFEQAIQQTAD